jgi:ZU5 domain
MKVRFVSAVLVVGVALIACSSSSSTSSPGGTGPGQTTPTTQTIGSAGGTVSAAGVVLTIPAGALSSDTPISITANAAAIPAGYTGLSPLFAFGPDGTKFASPATIAFTTSSPGTNPTVYWSNDTGGYDALATTLIANGVSAQVQHFSTGFAANKFLDVVDAGKISDAGEPITDAGPSAGTINMTVDGVATAFSSNSKVTLGTGTTTIQADDDPSTTHWTIQIVMTGIPQESCQLNGNPYITYTHYTGGGLDKLYQSKSGGNCLLTLSSNPANPGDHATGTVISGSVGKSNAPVGDPATHAFGSGSFDLTL